MDITIYGATDAITRKINEHGIVHGLKRFANHEVKIIVIETPSAQEEPQPLAWEPSRDQPTPVTREEPEAPEEPDDQYYNEPVPDLPYSSEDESDILVSTTDLIRGFIKK